MAYAKTCPACGTKNAPGDMMCSRCLGDISGVPPVDSAVHNKPDDACLILRTDDGRDICVHHVDVVGRTSVGKEVFESLKTVSRRHIRITCENGVWLAEDLNTSNATYVDDRKLTPGEKTVLCNAQILRLSSSVALKVITQK